MNKLTEYTHIIYPPVFFYKNNFKKELDETLKKILHSHIPYLAYINGEKVGTTIINGVEITWTSTGTLKISTVNSIVARKISNSIILALTLLTGTLYNSCSKFDVVESGKHNFRSKGILFAHSKDIIEYTLGRDKDFLNCYKIIKHVSNLAEKFYKSRKYEKYRSMLDITSYSTSGDYDTVVVLAWTQLEWYLRNHKDTKDSI